MRRGLALLLLLSTLGVRAGPSATATATAPTTPVVLIVLENRAYGAVLDSPAAPYLNGTLIPAGTLYENYWAVGHPSLPNYIALVAGDTLGCATDSCKPVFGQPNLFAQLDGAHIDWRAYEESMPSRCFGANFGDYVIRHNPAIYFTDLSGGSCAAKDVPMPPKLNAGLAPFTFLTPNICHDMHSCPIATGDRWLAIHVPDYMAAGAIVIVTFDEGSGATNHVLTVAAGPGMSPGVTDPIRYNHYGLLAGLEAYFHLQFLKHANTATSLPLG